MGAFRKLVDAFLFIFFLVMAILAPFIDASVCLPTHLCPSFLVELKSWYVQESGDYLFSEKPNFFVGTLWFEFLFCWPLQIASLYGIAAGKSWFATTCLMYGVSTLTGLAAVLPELVWSNRASQKQLMIYFSYLGFGVVTLLRGLLGNSGNSMTIPALNRKKRA